MDTPMLVQSDVTHQALSKPKIKRARTWGRGYFITTLQAWKVPMLAVSLSLMGLQVHDSISGPSLLHMITIRPLIGDLKFLIHRPHLFSTSTRFAITPLFHTAHAQKILPFDLLQWVCSTSYNGLLQEQTKYLNDELCRASLICKLIMNNGNDPPARTIVWESP